MTVDMSAAAISGRLDAASEQSDLHADRRLDTKIGYSAAELTRRLREVDALNALCRALRSAVPVG